MQCRILPCNARILPCNASASRAFWSLAAFTSWRRRVASCVSADLVSVAAGVMQACSASTLSSQVSLCLESPSLMLPTWYVCVGLLPNGTVTARVSRSQDVGQHGSEVLHASHHSMRVCTCIHRLLTTWLHTSLGPQSRLEALTGPVCMYVHTSCDCIANG